MCNEWRMIMIKVDEHKLVEVIDEAMELAFRIPVMRKLDCLSYLYKIFYENMLEMNDDDLDKLFRVVECRYDKKGE